MQSTGPAKPDAPSWDVWSWRSIELQVNTRYVHYGVTKLSIFPREPQITTHYIETTRNQRLLELTVHRQKAPHVQVTINYSDGQRFASLLRREEDGQLTPPQVTIQRSFSVESRGLTDRPAPLKYLYVGLKPVHEVLNQGERLSPAQHLHRTCDRYLFRHITGPNDSEQQVYWLDQATGVTLRHELFTSERYRIDDHPYAVWSALSLDEVAGRHIVRESELLTYAPWNADPTKVVRQYRDTVEKVVFDQDYPATLFWPKITNETKVFDTVANRVVIPKTAVNPALVGQPIRAVQPSSWAANAPIAGLLLGVAAIVAGLILWWRRS